MAANRNFSGRAQEVAPKRAANTAVGSTWCWLRARWSTKGCSTGWLSSGYKMPTLTGFPARRFACYPRTTHPLCRRRTFLPTGYPSSVRKEYMEYQTWDTVQVCHLLRLQTRYRAWHFRVLCFLRSVESLEGCKQLAGDVVSLPLLAPGVRSRVDVLLSSVPLLFLPFQPLGRMFR